jgi:hypothetical protein
LYAELKREFESFTAFRDGIPAAVLLSINAKRILESFSVVVDKGPKARALSVFGVKPMETICLTIPADISDQDAIHALNNEFRELFPDKQRPAVYEPYIETITHGTTRRSDSREIRLVAVVDGTAGESRQVQGEVLKQKGLIFSHPIDQALAAAAYACKRKGEDLFRGKVARCSVPKLTLGTDFTVGVRIVWYGEELGAPGLAASGSFSHEIKMT